MYLYLQINEILQLTDTWIHTKTPPYITRMEGYESWKKSQETFRLDHQSLMKQWKKRLLLETRGSVSFVSDRPIFLKPTLNKRNTYDLYPGIK